MVRFMTKTPVNASSYLRQQAPRPLGLYMMLLKSAEAAAISLAPTAEDKTAAATAAARDVALFLEGVTRYRAFPWARGASVYTPVAAYGRCALVHVGGQGVPVLLVPSMVNKPYILDLLPEASLAQTLIKAGYAVYMLDWGVPEGDTPLTVDAAVADILLPALADVATHAAGQKPVVLGYCMGGNLALAALAHAPHAARAFVAAATPWDFADSTFGALVKLGGPFYQLMLSSLPLVPVDMLQTAFMLLDPMGPVRRLQAFATETDPVQLRRMAAMEDWLADGIPLEAPIARTCLFDWYAANLPVQNRWQVAGKAIVPAELDLPALVAIPQRDVVVPAPSARALADALPNATVLEVPTGHIGMMVGRRAKSGFFDPLLGWLDGLTA
jgi:polyhydroxyalkanoate synthase